MDANTITNIGFKDVDLAGIKVNGEWHASDGRLSLVGIKTFEQLSTLFNALAPQDNGLTDAMKAGLQRVVIQDDGLTEADMMAAAQATVFPPEAAPTPVAVAPQLTLVKEAPEAPAALEAPAVAAAPRDPEDMSVFGMLTQLKDIIPELRRRGAVNFEQIKVRIADLRAAEMCPALDKIPALDDRIKSTCIALGVPGTL